MHKLITFFLFLAFATPIISYSCSCISPEGKGFCAFVSYADAVVRAQIEERDPTTGQLVIRVEEYLAGIPLSGSLVLSYGMCTLTWPEGPVGTSYILALRETWDHETTGNYQVTGCAISVLEMEGNMVTGRINSGRDQRMSYNQFKLQLKKPSCEASSVDFAVSYHQQRIKLIDASKGYSGTLQVQIIDLQGRKVGGFEVAMSKGEAQDSDTPVLPVNQGVYGVIITTEEDLQVVRKVVVQ